MGANESSGFFEETGFGSEMVRFKFCESHFSLETLYLSERLGMFQSQFLHVHKKSEITTCM